MGFFDAPAFDKVVRTTYWGGARMPKRFTVSSGPPQCLLLGAPPSYAPVFRVAICPHTLMHVMMHGVVRCVAYPD